MSRPVLVLLLGLNTPDQALSQSMTIQEMEAKLLEMQRQMLVLQDEIEILRGVNTNTDPQLPEQAAPNSGVVLTGDSGPVLADHADGTAGESDGFPVAGREEILADATISPLGRGEENIDPDFEKSAPLFGSDYRFSIGGYAKTDLIFDFDGVGDPYQFVLGQIPVADSPPGGSYSQLHIRESRTHLEIRNVNSPFNLDKFFLEFDFFDGAESTNFRLRHAYFQFGQLQAGRTWSILTELRALPLMLDFAAGDALLGGRSEQIKWDGNKIFGKLDWAVGLESYDATRIVIPESIAGRGIARSRTPRLSGGISYPWDQGVLSVGASVNEVRFDGSDGLEDRSELGWTTVLGSRVYLRADQPHFLGFNAGYTKGTLSDIIAFANAGTPNAALSTEGNLELAEGWNANVGLHLSLSDKVTSNLHYAYTRMEKTPELFAPDEMAKGWAAHANLIYDFDSRFRVGVEYMWGERETVDGSSGDAARLQFSTFYYY
ncbi:hypothetical protein R0135_08170 [Congregibacter variabilis]|uniref:Porin subfamily protein n=1 Tax=Congregibacter variabilis TaxID=3081200 RepID=A0ABZ0I6J7_9GAMM|nr:hypothetical protein R0135_08170 [Congregibacter sp. IMCC43200]